jgi:hypothetical protein
MSCRHRPRYLGAFEQATKTDGAREPLIKYREVSRLGQAVTAEDVCPQERLGWASIA